MKGGGAQRVEERVSAERRLDVGVAKRRLEGGVTGHALQRLQQTCRNTTKDHDI